MEQRKVNILNAGTYSRSTDNEKNYFLVVEGNYAYGDTNVGLVASDFVRRFGKSGLDLLVLHPRDTSNWSGDSLAREDLRDLAKCLAQASDYKFGVIISEEMLKLGN